jgi:hypothetical protein
MLVESIDHMHETSLVLEEKWSKFQEANLAKQLDYFKSRNNLIKKTQMNMVWTITSLIEIMNMVLKLDKGKKNHLLKKDYHEQWSKDDSKQQEIEQKKIFHIRIK